MNAKLYSNSIFEKLRDNLRATNVQPNLLTDYKHRQLSGAQILNYIDSIAADLLHLGVKKDDRVLFLSKISIESVLYFFALSRVGAILVLVDPEMGQDNFVSRVEFSKINWILQDKVLEKIGKYSFLRAILKFLNIWFPEKLPVQNKVTIKSLREIDRLSAPSKVNDELLPEEKEMVIIFTSGTVSEPKGVVHSYQSLSAALNIIASEISITKNDFLYASQFYFLLIGLVIAAKTYIPKNKPFSAKRFLKISRRQKITSAFLLPFEGELIYKNCIQNKAVLPESFKTILFGSAPVTKGFLARFSSICPPSLKVYGVYGSTEMLPISIIEMNEKLKYPGDGDLLGKPTKRVQVEINNDNEIIVSGPQLYTKYLGESENAKYFYSGDLGKIDSDGNIVLLGRKKDMIIRKGHNVYPALFESSISKIPGVTECAIVGVYDPKIEDEKITLFVVPDSREPSYIEQLKQHLRSGNYSIDTYAYPDEIILIDAMPRSGRSKKVDKKTLQDMARKKLCIQ